MGGCSSEELADEDGSVSGARRMVVLSWDGGEEGEMEVPKLAIEEPGGLGVRTAVGRSGDVKMDRTAVLSDDHSPLGASFS